MVAPTPRRALTPAAKESASTRRAPRSAILERLSPVRANAVVRSFAGAIVLMASITSSCLLEFDPALLEAASSCTGCDDGVACQAGTSAAACGRDGEACQVCAAPTAQCLEGRCVVEHAAVSVAASDVNTMMVDVGGTLWVWGGNMYGQLGIPGAVDALEPVALSNGWRSVAIGLSGSGHACAIAGSGVLSCWGQNGDGQTGTGEGTSPEVPTEVVGDQDWLAVAAGPASTCGVRAPGRLYCWGWNGDGRLGVDVIENAPTPLPLGEDEDWAAVDVGGSHACALRADSTLWCWGANGAGQLGRGGPSIPPAVVAETATSWSQVSAGDEHTCGLREDGSVWCWGESESGRLGFAGSAAVPTQVGTTTGFRDVSAGGRHTCAVHGDGSLWCWGDNTEGQSGQSGAADVLAPARVGQRSDYVDVECGGLHTCAVVETGALLCFGYNGHGELGNSLLSSSSTPTDVVFPP